MFEDGEMARGPNELQQEQKRQRSGRPPCFLPALQKIERYPRPTAVAQ